MILQQKAEQVTPLKKHHKVEIYENLKASWEDMQARRESGETGRLEFSDPMPEGVI